MYFKRTNIFYRIHPNYNIYKLLTNMKYINI